jgi:hypothetical protein
MARQPCPLLMLGSVYIFPFPANRKFPGPAGVWVVAGELAREASGQRAPEP